MTEDQLFEIACIIDGEYKGKRKTFTAKRIGNVWHLTTNVPDWAYLIQISEISNKIGSIKVLGVDTETWADVNSNTWKRVEKHLASA